MASIEVALGRRLFADAFTFSEDGMTRLTLALTALLTLSAAGANAAPITFGYSGTIVSVGGFDPAYIDDPAGTTFSGEYTFESTAPDLIPDPSGEQGSYAGSSLSLALSNLNYLFGSMSIGVSNLVGPAFDQYLVSFFDADTSFSIRLEDAQGTAFSSDALPVSAPLLTPFENRFFFFQVLDPNGDLLVDVNGTITSLQCLSGCLDVPDPAVPEPASLVLVPSGLAALAAIRRRRREQR